MPVDERADFDGTDPVYALGSDLLERKRLQGQSTAFRPHTAMLLDRVGVERGWRAMDLGCGPSGALELLWERVGPTGHVTGLDFDPLNVDLARDFVRERGFANVEVLQGDARQTGLPSNSFDVVHARTLLCNVPDPSRVAAEMARLVKPGGFVAALEPDTALTMCYPPLPEWDRLTEIFYEAYRVDGADPFIGRRLAELFREAGLIDGGVDAFAEVYPPGHPRRTIRPDLVRTMRAKIIANGIASEGELDELDRVVRERLADPRTVAMPTVMFVAWARKPGGAIG